MNFDKRLYLSFLDEVKPPINEFLYRVRQSKLYNFFYVYIRLLINFIMSCSKVFLYRIQRDDFFLIWFLKTNGAFLLIIFGLGTLFFCLSGVSIEDSFIIVVWLSVTFGLFFYHMASATMDVINDYITSAEIRIFLISILLFIVSRYVIYLIGIVWVYYLLS